MQCKQQAIALLTEGFCDKRKQHEKDKEALVEDLYKQIGKQKVAIVWLKKRLDSLSKSIHLEVRQKKTYIEKQAALS